MTLTILILLAVGLLLILLEAFVPGGILGLTGAVLLAVSAYLAFAHFSTQVAVSYLIASLVLAASAGLAAFLFVVKRAQLKLPESATHTLSHFADEAAGTVVRVVKTLNPTGTVEVNGKRVMARSAFTQEQIPAGSNAVVISVDGSYLVVRPETKAQEA